MSGFVYFIADEHPHFIKIGYSSKNPIDRMAALQTGSPLKLRLLAQIPGDIELERKLHRTFAPLRLHGEWFSYDGKLCDFMCYIEEPSHGKSTSDMLDAAVHDVVLASTVNYPFPDPEYCEFWLNSADPSEWGGFIQ